MKIKLICDCGAEGIVTTVNEAINASTGKKIFLAEAQGDVHIDDECSGPFIRCDKCGIEIAYY